MSLVLLIATLYLLFLGAVNTIIEFKCRRKRPSLGIKTCDDPLFLIFTLSYFLEPLGASYNALGPELWDDILKSEGFDNADNHSMGCKQSMIR